MALPALTVRTYPAFRPARLYRVFVSGDSLYFIRLGGLISPSDAGHGHSIDPGKRAVAALIGWIAKKSINAELARLESTDPARLLELDKKHFKVAPDEVIDSRLDSPSLFSQQRPCLRLETLGPGSQGGDLRDRRPGKPENRLETPAAAAGRQAQGQGRKSLGRTEFIPFLSLRWPGADGLLGLIIV